MHDCWLSGWHGQPLCWQMEHASQAIEFVGWALASAWRLVHRENWLPSSLHAWMHVGTGGIGFGRELRLTKPIRATLIKRYSERLGRHNQTIWLARPKSPLAEVGAHPCRLEWRARSVRSVAECSTRSKRHARVRQSILSQNWVGHGPNGLWSTNKLGQTLKSSWPISSVPNSKILFSNETRMLLENVIPHYL